MAETKESRQAKYLERNGLVQINMTIPIEVRDFWKNEAICRGMSIKQMLIAMVNGYINFEQMERKRAQKAVCDLIAKSKEEDK